MNPFWLADQIPQGLCDHPPRGWRRKPRSLPRAPLPEHLRGGFGRNLGDREHAGRTAGRDTVRASGGIEDSATPISWSRRTAAWPASATRRSGRFRGQAWCLHKAKGRQTAVRESGSSTYRRVRVRAPCVHREPGNRQGTAAERRHHLQCATLLRHDLDLAQSRLPRRSAEIRNAPSARRVVNVDVLPAFGDGGEDLDDSPVALQQHLLHAGGGGEVALRA